LRSSINPMILSWSQGYERLREKFFSIYLLLVCLVANGAEVKNKSPLVLAGKPPQGFSKLPPEAKADLLCSIAESSYKILMQVPETGLRDSRDSIEKIISARKWLEKTDDLVARILAINLCHVVDSVVLNEMYRKEKLRHGRSLTKAFKDNSFDNTLVNSLLKQNKIDEGELINFALGLDTKIGKFCRQSNYKTVDFLTGKIFEEAWQQMLIPIITGTRIIDGNEVEIIKEGSVREVDLMLVIFWTGRKVESTKELAEFFLPMVLNCIDETRDVRLFARIHMKYGGFADRVQIGRHIIDSNSLKNRVLTELSNENIWRLTSHSRRGEPVTTFDVLDSISRITNRVEVGMEIYSEADLTIKFVPFVTNLELFPEEFREMERESGFFGMWLNLPD